MSQNDTTTGLDILVKQPGESMRLDLPMGPRMRTSDTISSVDAVTATVISPGTGTVTVSGETSSGTTVQANFAGGADGEQYRIQATITTGGGDTIKTDAMLNVDE